MGCFCSCSQRVGHRIELAQRLTASQVVKVDTIQLQRRRELVEALHGEKYTPRASCPECSHDLSDYEIMKGFKDDPRDYTTCCPKCQHRFLPRMFHVREGGTTDIAFYCPMQILDRLPALKDVPLDEFRTKHAAEYSSAVIHFGGLKQAFAKIDLIYAHEAALDWKNQVGSFLGKMPDTVIAELVGAKAWAVRRLRRDQGILAYSRRVEAENLDE
jgi:hypothetical protein